MRYIKLSLIFSMLLLFYMMASPSTLEAKRQYMPLSPLGANEFIANITKNAARAGLHLTDPNYTHIGDDMCFLLGFNHDGCISVYVNNSLGVISNINVEFDIVNHAPIGARSTIADGYMVLGIVLAELGAEEQDIRNGLTDPMQRDAKKLRENEFKKTYTVYSRSMRHNLEICVEASDTSEDISFDIWAFK